MDITKIPTPEDITAYAKVFTEAMDSMNKVSHAQLMGILDLTLTGLKALPTGGGTPPVTDEHTAQLKAALEKLQAPAGPPLPEPTVPEPTTADATSDPLNPTHIVETAWRNLSGSLMQALANAFSNAVTNQQQTNVTAQATLTATATMLISAWPRQPSTGTV